LQRLPQMFLRARSPNPSRSPCRDSPPRRRTGLLGSRRRSPTAPSAHRSEMRCEHTSGTSISHCCSLDCLDCSALGLVSTLARPYCRPQDAHFHCIPLWAVHQKAALVSKRRQPMRYSPSSSVGENYGGSSHAPSTGMLWACPGRIYADRRQRGKKKAFIFLLLKAQIVYNDTVTSSRLFLLGCK
jgi:hypothetical protein